MPIYKKENDYTLSVVTDVPTGGTLCRIFNFAAKEVISIFREQVEKREKIDYHSAVSTSISVALAAQMTTKNFSAFDSQDEIDMMREQLKREGGYPPNATDLIDKVRPAGPKNPTTGLG